MGCLDFRDADGWRENLGINRVSETEDNQTEGMIPYDDDDTRVDARAECCIQQRVRWDTGCDGGSGDNLY